MVQHLLSNDRRYEMISIGIANQSGKSKMNPRNRHRRDFLALSVLAVTGFGARAHGLPQSKFGGMLATELDLGFELFFRDGKALIYITDHDSPFSTTYFKATLTIDDAAPVVLQPGGEGLLVGQLTSGAKRPSRAKAVVEAKGLDKPVTVVFGDVGKFR